MKAQISFICVFGSNNCLYLFLRYLHVLMIFWSFVAGVVTFYCSLGPDSLLPNIFFMIKYKPKVKYMCSYF